MREYLGETQREILETLWGNSDGLTPQQVHASLNTDSAYITIYTLLRRLQGRGLVESNNGVYRATVSREAFVRRILLDIRDNFPNEFAAIIRNHRLTAENAAAV